MPVSHQDRIVTKNKPPPFLHIHLYVIWSNWHLLTKFLDPIDMEQSFFKSCPVPEILLFLENIQPNELIKLLKELRLQQNSLYQRLRRFTLFLALQGVLVRWGLQYCYIINYQTLSNIKQKIIIFFLIRGLQISERNLAPSCQRFQVSCNCLSSGHQWWPRM